MVRRSQRIPDRGDLVWIDFDPQAGREQAGRRPALVLSPASYNGKVGLALFCPITSRAKGYPFEVAIPSSLAISGVVLADQLKSLGWRQRNLSVAARMPTQAVGEVQSKVGVLLGMRVADTA